MAARLYKTVKPAGGDYTSLEACMNANEQDLVAADKYFDVEISGDWDASPDTTAVTIHNYTTDATRYINIYTSGAARHSGNDASGYKILITGLAVALTISNNYTTVEAILIRLQLNTSYTRQCAVNYGHESIIRQCIMRATNASTGQANGITLAGGDGTKTQAINCIIIPKTWGFDLSGGGAPPGIHYAINCTVYGGVNGFQEGYGNNYVINCLSIDNSNYDFDSGFSMTTCGSSDATGTAGLQNFVAATEFVDLTAGAEILKLKTGAESIDAGTDQGETPVGVNFDIIDRDRHAEGDIWDLGAHEWVSVGIKVIPKHGFISGYHCFMSQYLRAQIEGLIPLKLPDGTVF